MKNINFYKFNENVGVVECFIEDEFISIKNKLGDFSIEDKTLPKKSWQAIYMEQYYNENKMEKICETYDEPKENSKNFWLVFFIFFLEEGQTLNTPYGNITVSELKNIPSIYKNTLDFEEVD